MITENLYFVPNSQVRENFSWGECIKMWHDREICSTMVSMPRL